MKIQMLGTGAADGWPTPFCTCASCSTARENGHIRRQTSALVDDVLLIDCGAETGRSAVHAGRRLDELRVILFTHAHPDHCDPQLLLWRAWSGLAEGLIVAGPHDALERCRPWLGPDDPVDLVPLTSGDDIDLGGYRVRAVSATHTPGSLLYDLTAPDGTSLLYATDTGPLRDDAIDSVAGRSFDVVLLEETWGDRTDHEPVHHDLASFADTVRVLRQARAITEGTDVIAIHLGHDNPPEPELARRLAAFGARALLDHDIVETGPTPTAPRGPAQRTFVLGGARSGKSREAERLVAAEQHVTYIATSIVDNCDAEWVERVAAHRERRPAHWRTLETLDLATAITKATPNDTLLIDCLTLWLTGIVDASGSWGDADAAHGIVTSQVDELVAALRTTNARVVCVSNEVGSGIVPDTSSGRLFRDLLGRVNVAVAAECDDVLLVTAGRVQRL